MTVFGLQGAVLPVTMPLGRSYNFQRYRWQLKSFSVFTEPRCPLPCTKNPPYLVESVSTPYIK